MKKVSTQTETLKVLKKFNFNFKKKFGQNFLVDQNILSKIVKTADISGKTVVEIGPGIGALTQYLSDSAKYVVAYEIDTTLKEILKETLASCDNTTVIFSDILTSDIKETVENENFSVVANLPYYITTPIIENLITYKNQVESITIMMQKEVAERICAREGNKSYGTLSIFLQTYFDATLEFIVPKTVFIPKPDVDSAILKLKPITPRIAQEDEEEFQKFIKICFATRRKTIKNNLINGYGKERTLEILQKLQLEETLRPEQISVSDYIHYFNIISH